MAKRKKKRKREPHPVNEEPRPVKKDPVAILKLLLYDPPWGYWLVVIAAFAFAAWLNVHLLDGNETLKWHETTGKIVKVKATSKGGRHGLVTIEGFRATFDGWWNRVVANNPISRRDRVRKVEVFEELRPATILGVQLARELGIPLERAK